MSVQASASRPLGPTAPAAFGCYGSGGQRTGPSVPLQGTGLSALSKDEMSACGLGGIAAAPAIAAPLGGSINATLAGIGGAYMAGPSGG
eukprot:831592-Amphidinium_carterae.1